MHKRELITHPIRSFRTAPLGIAAIGIVGILPVPEVLLDPTTGRYGSLATLAMAAAGMYAGNNLVTRQFNLRARLEKSLETYGFDERIVEMTVGEWCTRQTTLVACEQFKVREQCEEYYASRRDAMELSWLPHF